MHVCLETCTRWLSYDLTDEHLPTLPDPVSKHRTNGGAAHKSRHAFGNVGHHNLALFKLHGRLLAATKEHVCGDKTGVRLQKTADGSME